MKNNRQVGLDGRVFITGCLKKSSFFVFGLFFYGIISAAGDILKLLGKSGVLMNSMTTTLIFLDLVISLIFVVVVFYSYFLECGSNIPIIKDKPIIILGTMRLVYNVLLCYYILYRTVYCLVNTDTTPLSTFFFYFCMFVLAILSILACCFVLNILSRNMIRRSYIKTFKRLSTCGILFSAAMPICYLVSRIWFEDFGDEYFTHALCDTIRLLIAPVFYTSIWFIFVKATENVNEVFNEVDNAVRERRYQISYTVEDVTEEDGKKALPSHDAKEAQSHALSAASETEVKALSEGSSHKKADAAKPADTSHSTDNRKAADISKKSESAVAVSDSDKSSDEKDEGAKDNNSPQLTEAEIEAASAAAVAKVLSQQTASKPKKPSEKPRTGNPPAKKSHGNKRPPALTTFRSDVPNFVPAVNDTSVKEFDPYKKPRKPQSGSSQTHTGQKRRPPSSPNGKRPPSKSGGNGGGGKRPPSDSGNNRY
ncbi:MAG: hypothetical protein LBL82_04390 [Oscillospiraceae bacterium]|jgi:hypothetical protein|nr:hypothetical protein [Oscillospiraceae bacterium]